MAKQMAIIRDVQWSPNDERNPGLRLNVALYEASGTHLTIPPHETWSLFQSYELISPEGIRFADLNGKPVWVEEEDGIIRFIGPCVV